MTALADYLYSTPDAVVWRAVGLVASGALVLLWACLRLTARGA